MKIKERFERFIVKDISNCWVWNGSVNLNGYGQFRVAQKIMLAHRASYELYKSEIIPGLIVRHKCLSKKCVNPEHLELGTYTDNARDRVRDGTQYRGGSKRKNNLIKIDNNTILSNDTGVIGLSCEI